MAPTGRRLPVKFSVAAQVDLDVAFAYVTERNRAAAVELLDKLRSGIGRLGEFPKMGSALPSAEFGFIPQGTRFTVVEPYLIFYRVTTAAVVVTRVLHARQDSLGALLE